MALLVFTLTATFDMETTISCRSLDHQNYTYTVVYTTDFPFDYLDYNYRYEANNTDDRMEFDRDYGAMAQSFLAWGVITLIYCMIAVFAYIMLNESQEWKHYEKTSIIFYLAVSDALSFHALLNSDFSGFWWFHTVVYFVACSQCCMDGWLYSAGGFH